MPQRSDRPSRLPEVSARDRRISVLILITGIAVAASFLVGRIPQDPLYHLFADTREIAGIANFWNVVSNLPFLVAGWIGFSRRRNLLHEESKGAYMVPCAGVFLVGVGSAYYHHAPTNASLVWDRLPMTVAFMALFSMLLEERVIAVHEKALLWLLVTAGIGSVEYWSWTESRGHGDLRPYALVQFLPLLLMPVVLFMFPRRYLSDALLLGAFGWYCLAKALEHFDGQILRLTGFTSGHPLKHVAAAVAVLFIIYAVPTRKSRQTADGELRPTSMP